jgi:hypothetical protein
MASQYRRDAPGPTDWPDSVTPSDDHGDTWRTFLRSPHRSTSVIALTGAAVVALICWYFGLDAWQALTFGAVSGSLGLFYLALPDLREVHWRDFHPTRTGARHDISWLASSLRPRYGRVGDEAVRALRDLAQQRLALCHLDLTTPDHQSQIERFIGRDVYAVLQPGRRRRPTYRTVVNCLDALDRLSPAEERT